MNLVFAERALPNLAWAHIEWVRRRALGTPLGDPGGRESFGVAEIRQCAGLTARKERGKEMKNHSTA